MSNWEENWKGTKKEQGELISEVLQDIKSEHFEHLLDSEFNKLFAEAFCRIMVQSELVEMMLYIKDN